MRGYKSILLLLFLAVNAFALTPNENITNIAWSVKSNAQYSVQGNGAGLTNGNWLTRTQSPLSEWDWSFNFDTWTNENPALSIYRQGGDSLRFVGPTDNTITNNVALTNGAIRVNATNETFYYWNRSTTIPVQSVRKRIRYSTDGGANVDESYILVQRNPMVTGQSVTIAGQTNWFLHLLISKFSCGADLYTNGLNGRVANTVSAGDKSVPVPYRMKPGDVIDVGFDVLANGKGDTLKLVYGNYVQYWQSDFLTNLFAPMTGFGTNVTFEIVRHHPQGLAIEYEALAYSTRIGESWPAGTVPRMNADNTVRPPDITGSNMVALGPLSVGGITRITNSLAVWSNATFNFANSAGMVRAGGYDNGAASFGSIYFGNTSGEAFAFLGNGANGYIGVNGSLYFMNANNTFQMGQATTGQWLFNVPVSITGNATSAVFTATSLIAGGGGIASATTNATLTMAAGGITNTTTIQYTIYGFTGTGVVLTNLSRPINITLGTITAPATIVLQPNDALMGTLCSAAGDRGF